MEKFLDFLVDFGIWGLVIHSFIDAVIFPIPALFTQIPLSLLNPSQALWLATAGFIACLLGTPVGYVIGRFLGQSVLYKILKKKWIEAASNLFRKHGEAAVLIGAFTPIPFKVFTLMSGFLSFPLWKLMLYASLGRAAKFYVVGLLFYLFGQAAEGMVHEVSLYLFLVAVPTLLLGLYVKRRIQRRRQAVEPERMSLMPEVKDSGKELGS